MVALAAGTAAAAAYSLYKCMSKPKPDKRTFVLKGGKVEVHISPWGATITKLFTPDKRGKIDDIVCGFDSLEPYQDGTSPYFGCIVGRVANRIAKAKFKLKGRTYSLAANNGPNCLHGGLVGFDKVWWKAEPIQTADSQSVKLTYVSKSGEEGFPGNLTVTVTYSVQTNSDLSFGETSLVTTMEAVTDAATPVSLAQHTYWNLGGHASGSVLDTHSMRITGARYTPVDKDLIPTGEIKAVAGTPFDFQTAKLIGRDIAKVDGGYDHNYVVSNKVAPDGVETPPMPPRLAASVVHVPSGRAMDLLTDAPGMQFYSGNFLDGTIVGKGGVAYVKHNGFCLETQGYPDAINQSSFPNVVLQPGQTYKHTMVHRFYVRP